MLSQKAKNLIRANAKLFRQGKKEGVVTSKAHSNYVGSPNGRVMNIVAQFDASAKLGDSVVANDFFTKLFGTKLLGSFVTSYPETKEVALVLRSKPTNLSKVCRTLFKGVEGFKGLVNFNDPNKLFHYKMERLEKTGRYSDKAIKERAEKKKARALAKKKELKAGKDAPKLLTEGKKTPNKKKATK